MNTANLLAAVAFVVMVTVDQPVSSNVYTSSLKITRMMKREKDVLENLLTFAKSQRLWLKNLERFHKNRSGEFPETSKNLDLHHPNALYIAIRRFYVVFKQALKHNYEDFVANMTNSNKIFVPNGKDVVGALVALLRLQSVYNLSAVDMAEGNYLGYYGPKLDTHDAYKLGQMALSVKKFNESIDWLRVALSLHSQNVIYPENREETPSLVTIKCHLGISYFTIGDRDKAQKEYDEARQINAYNKMLPTLDDLLQNVTEKAAVLPSQPKYFHNYSRLCQKNDDYFVERADRLAVCRYKQTILPYYNFQEEILSISPFVTLIYYVISDSESERIRDQAKDKLSGIQPGQFAAKQMHTNTRSSAWFNSDQSDDVGRINNRISLITRLATDYRFLDGSLSKEPMQVVNYGIGGHYDVHADPIDKKSRFSKTEIKYSGKRLATFQIYLTDVDKGGSTVFTQAGISVTPVKNAALMWFNYDSALRLDDKTVHGGCPVIIGEKWILNKWIGTYENTFKRRCGIRPEMTQLDIEPDMKNGYL